MLNLEKTAAPSKAGILRTRAKIEPLTSIRFLAALWVVFLHTAGAVWPVSSGSFLGRALACGYLSVGFFFMLSGYILAVVYLQAGKPINAPQFWQARFARIYPVFVLTLLLDMPHLFVIEATGHSVAFGVRASLGKLIANLFMLQAWYPRLRGPDGPNWSLSVETFFYALFPLIGVWLWKLNRRSLFTWIFGIYAFSLLAVAIAMNRVPDEALRYNPLSNLGIFLMGILLAKIHTEYLRGDRARLRLQAVAPWLACAGAAIIVLCVQFSNVIPLQFLWHGLPAPAFACILLAFSSGQQKMEHLFSFRWMIVLGEASYALYLVHVPAWHLCQLFRLQITPVLYVLYLAITIGASVLSFFYFEAPARRFILNYFSTYKRDSLLSSSLS